MSHERGPRDTMSRLSPMVFGAYELAKAEARHRGLKEIDTGQLVLGLIRQRPVLRALADQGKTQQQFLIAHDYLGEYANNRNEEYYEELPESLRLQIIMRSAIRKNKPTSENPLKVSDILEEFVDPDRSGGIGTELFEMTKVDIKKLVSDTRMYELLM